MDAPDLVLHFGSRAGSLVAMLLFGLLFAAVGVVIARRSFERRLRFGSTMAAVALFAGPMTLLYSTSLNGFYEALFSPAHLELRYLVPFSTTRIAWSELAWAEARPAFRGRWRLHLVLASGQELVSATWHREPVESAAHRLRARLIAPQVR